MIEEGKNQGIQSTNWRKSNVTKHEFKNVFGQILSIETKKGNIELQPSQIFQNLTRKQDYDSLQLG